VDEVPHAQEVLMTQSLLRVTPPSYPSSSGKMSVPSVRRVVAAFIFTRYDDMHRKPIRWRAVVRVRSRKTQVLRKKTVTVHVRDMSVGAASDARR